MTQSYDEGYIYGVLTTSQSEVFNKDLKGKWLLLVTTIVKITFTQLNTYFV